MKKIITIEGMSCAHCQKRVEDALNAIGGVSAKVNLKKKTAAVTLKTDVADDVLMAAVQDAGYQPLSVKKES